MPLLQLQNVNFGITKADLTGIGGVGFTVLDDLGNVIQPRTTAGVYQLASGSGLYAAQVTFATDFHGQIMWDTGDATGSIAYATEDYNFEDRDPRVQAIYNDTQFMTGTLVAVSGSLEFVRAMTEGRWKIESNQMKFFKPDGITLIAKFDLFDDVGAPSMDAVFERRVAP